MAQDRSGQIAVIFVSARTDQDGEGYAAAAEAMAALAEQQPGYRGTSSARDPDGVGVTVSYWADEATAGAWRDHAEHARIREMGRDRWYLWYELTVARVERGYDWRRE